MRLHLTLALLILCFADSFGQQNEVPFQAFLNPNGTRLRLDGVELEKVGDRASYFSQQLAPGTHQLEVWHPYFEMHVETINVQPGEAFVFRHNLTKQNQAYQELQLQLRKPKRQTTTAVLGAVAVNALSIIPIFSYDKTLEQDRFLELEQTLEALQLATDAASIQSLKDTYNQTRDDVIKMQRNRNLRRGIGIPLVAGINALAAYVFIKNKREVKRINDSFQGPPAFTIRTGVTENNQLALILNF